MRTAVARDSVTSLEVFNLGLTTRKAMNVQCALREYNGYTGAIDGNTGPQTTAAFKRAAADAAQYC